MNEKKIEAAKARLEIYRDLALEVESQTMRLERIENKLYGLGAQSISDMPKSQNQCNDRITDLLEQKGEIEEELGKTLDYIKRERKIIKSGIRKLSKSEARMIMSSRYIDCEDWKDVNELLYGGRRDFNGKEDSYLRKTFKIHKNALEDIAVYLSNQKNN